MTFEVSCGLTRIWLGFQAHTLMPVGVLRLSLKRSQAPLVSVLVSSRHPFPLSFPPPSLSPLSSVPFSSLLALLRDRRPPPTNDDDDDDYLSALSFSMSRVK